MVVVVVCGGSVLSGDYMMLVLVLDFREVMWTSPPQIGPLAGRRCWGVEGRCGRGAGGWRSPRVEDDPNHIEDDPPPAH